MASDLKLMTEEEAAEALGVRPRTLRDIRRRREISFRRVGRFPRYTRRDLEEFVARMRVEVEA